MSRNIFRGEGNHLYILDAHGRWWTTRRKPRTEQRRNVHSMLSSPFGSFERCADPAVTGMVRAEEADLPPSTTLCRFCEVPSTTPTCVLCAQVRSGLRAFCETPKGHAYASRVLREAQPSGAPLVEVAVQRERTDRLHVCATCSHYRKGRGKAGLDGCALDPDVGVGAASSCESWAPRELRLEEEKTP